MHHNKIIFFATLFACTNGLFGTYMNLLNPHDTLIRPLYYASSNAQPSFIAETGLKHARGFNTHSHVVNVLNTLNLQQLGLSILDGFAPESSAGQLRTLITAGDDGTRGHLLFCGDLSLKTGAAVGGRFRVGLGNEWSLQSYLPFYVLELNNVSFVDKTLNNSIEDQRVHALLTDNLAAVLLQLGCLDISSWRRVGLGDWRTDILWVKEFAQHKVFLKNVSIELRLGLSLPTGKRADEDKLIAYSFGFDGSVAVPFGFGIELQLGSYIKTGLDIELTHIFGTTRLRRVKTWPSQPELLLLQKAVSHQDFGTNQCFNLHVGAYKMYDCLSLVAGYQFFKHGDDHLALKTNGLSNTIANSAQFLDESIMHHVVFNMDYDMRYHVNDKTTIEPHFSLFTRIPFKGKNAVLFDTIGASISFNF